MSPSGNHQPRFRYGPQPAVGAGFADQHAVSDGRRGILSHLPLGMRSHLDQRDLPEVQLDVAPVQLVGHALRVGPGAVGREVEVGQALRLGTVASRQSAHRARS